MDNNGKITSATIYETDDKNLIKEIIDYLNTFELKRWYKKKGYSLELNERYYMINFEIEDSLYRRVSLIKKYVQINESNYIIKNKANIENDYFKSILQRMSIQYYLRPRTESF